MRRIDLNKLAPDAGWDNLASQSQQKINAGISEAKDESYTWSTAKLRLKKLSFGKRHERRDQMIPLITSVLRVSTLGLPATLKIFVMRVLFVTAYGQMLTQVKVVERVIIFHCEKETGRQMMQNESLSYIY